MTNDPDLILGIDPGLTGAMVAIDFNGTICHWKRFKKVLVGKKDSFLDLADARAWILSIEPEVSVWLEKVWAFPEQGVSSSFKFGSVYGATQGLLRGIELTYSLVPSMTWHKEYDALALDLRGKDASKFVFKNLFKKHPFEITHKGNVHDGLIDATLIAEYGRRHTLGVLNGQNK